MFGIGLMLAFFSAAGHPMTGASVPIADRAVAEPASSSPSRPAAADTFPVGVVVDSVVSISDPTPLETRCLHPT
jgi:hypothetical protein